MFEIGWYEGRDKAHYIKKPFTLGEFPTGICNTDFNIITLSKLCEGELFNPLDINWNPEGFIDMCKKCLRLKA